MTAKRAARAPRPPPLVGVPSAPQSALRSGLELALVTAGIYGCYLRYGVLQEKIYATDYAGERFTSSGFLVMVQCTANASVALLALLVQTATGRLPARSLRPPAPRVLAEYALVALCYLSAMLFSFSALAHMSYPAQALGKSCKMIPVMAMGVVIRRRVYSRREVSCVLLISAGVALFSFKGSGGGGAATTPVGAALLLASLTMDGVTGPLQERLVARHAPPTHVLMLWQNVCAAAWLAGGLGASGRLWPAAEFVRRHAGHGLAANVAQFAAVSAVGQNFIFYCVRNFSALATTTITTTRKMFTVLLSIVLFKHAVKPRQWAGMGLVFAAIAWEGVAKARRAAKREAVQAAKGRKAE